MAGYFLLRAGVMLGEKPLIDDALHQFYWHIHYLQDEDTSLWYHGYNHLNKDHMSGMYWARANAWAAYTMSRVGHVAASLPVPSIYAYYKLGARPACRHQKAQKDDGLWGTVLDYPEAYGEVSATAGIAAAMVMQNNPLHAKHVELALKGVLDNISDRGRVLNVSGGTAVMNDIRGYLEVDKNGPRAGAGTCACLTFRSYRNEQHGRTG